MYKKPLLLAIVISGCNACQIVIVSDAGNKLPFEKLYYNTLTLLLRTVDTFMARIKNFQMMQNIYQKPNQREIAYLSLGWDLENCLPGFYNDLVTGNISPVVLAAHQMPQAWLQDPKAFKTEIIQFMAQKCQVQTILSKALPANRLQKIRNIGTNLTRIKPGLVNDMIVHAGNLTELQLRLYCPSLLTN